VLDWEERWRRLNPEVPDDPDLPVRPAGASAAAQAGARAGVGVAPPDVYDPERIKAALRGVHSRTGQASRRSGDSSVSAPAASGTRLDSPDQGLSADAGASADGWGTNSGWDPAPDPGVTAANGNHSASLGNRGPFDAAFATLAEPAEPASAEEFSWLQKSEPSDGSYSWSEQAEATRPAEQDDSDVTWPNAGLAARMAAGSGQADLGVADLGVTEQIPRQQAEGLAARERTDFWGHPVPPAPADLRTPAATPRAEEPTVTRASWSAADTAPPAAEPAHRTATAPAQPVSTAGVKVQAAGHERERREDRYFPARLLAVIVIAALIGSALVLLLK